MIVTTTPPTPDAALQTETAEPEFMITGKVLHISNTESTDLEAYLWYAPNNEPVYFVYIDNEVHVITLEKGEEEFNQVCTMNQAVDIRTVTDEEIAQYTAEADRMLARTRNAEHPEKSDS